MKKWLLIGGGVVAVAVVVVVVVIIVGLDDIVKAMVEEAGSDVTKVEVTLGEADVEVLEGRAALRQLIVNNPPGFETDNAFSLGEITAKVDTDTIGDDVLVINEIVVNRPQVTYELGENGSNIETLQRNVADYGKGGEKSSSSSEGPKVIIENLYIRDGQVSVSAVPLGGKSLSSTLPEIHLTDIGKEEDGAGADEIAERIMAAVTSQIGGFVSGLDLSTVFEGMETVPDALKDLAGGAIGEVESMTEGVTEGITENIGETLGENPADALGGESGGVTGGVGDAVEGVGDAVDDLLGN
jgi:hypothetical protein